MATITESINNKLEFEFLHKYMAKLIDVDLADAKQLRLVVQDQIAYLGKQVAIDWQDIAQRLVDDKYTCTFYSPASAWQHFKRDNMPEWFKRRYPVKNQPHKRTIKFTRYSTYPLANIKIPQTSRVFIQTLGGLERLEDQVRETGEEA